ncbi:uncharacterized protein MONOS_4030 [Monocercomonoides exilis]|uniref:uncharacterized protein n=1 Tax=Monocercomonoides exilis TaxID=2049356 RepID=UPI00355A47E3|nr:hypothetical protein MONOS_4030 [Monocercomonoides exilis]|eukprot:MONOS_4030.1-p1 / transcript=MONOS_4030.1 / gene=MONOS_4030 / organism=Monocercomonoides_exilis_PA203 / gene_product=unspecified product / transcript_product=unspecified product / location=Mono_scaffold00102:39247-39891(+) / protein_length=215 / sequence_SO=supercontig / SO=protein_coding / is_pseudo=false
MCEAPGKISYKLAQEEYGFADADLELELMKRKQEQIVVEEENLKALQSSSSKQNKIASFIFSPFVNLFHFFFPSKKNEKQNQNSSSISETQKDQSESDQKPLEETGNVVAITPKNAINPVTPADRSSDDVLVMKTIDIRAKVFSQFTPDVLSDSKCQPLDLVSIYGESTLNRVEKEREEEYYKRKKERMKKEKDCEDDSEEEGTKEQKSDDEVI